MTSALRRYAKPSTRLLSSALRSYKLSHTMRFVSLRNSYHVCRYRIHLPRHGETMRRDEWRCEMRYLLWRRTVFQSRSRTKIHSRPNHSWFPETLGLGTGRACKTFYLPASLGQCKVSRSISFVFSLCLLMLRS
jgi:hypothetical protein